MKIPRKNSFQKLICTSNTIQHMEEAMLLKRRYITNPPTLQIYLHKMLHLCSDSSVTGFQWRNVEATTYN